MRPAESMDWDNVKSYDTFLQAGRVISCSDTSPLWQDLMSVLDRLNVKVIDIDCRGLTTESQFFDRISTILEFPDYFGKNWDAMLELINDLEWLPFKNIAIVFRSFNAIKDVDRSLANRIVALCELDPGKGFNYELRKLSFVFSD